MSRLTASASSVELFYSLTHGGAFGRTESFGRLVSTSSAAITANARSTLPWSIAGPGSALPRTHRNPPRDFPTFIRRAAKAQVEIVARIVKRTPDATLIELPDDPRAGVGVAKLVPCGGHAGRFGCERLLVPVWLYRKLREQL